MSNIVNLPSGEAISEIDNPIRRTIRRRSRAFAGLFTLALALAIAFAALLATAALVYDGPLLAFGPGGIHVAPSPAEAARLLPLSAFSFAQRLIGAFALTLLTGPPIFIFAHLRRLFQLYATGSVFAPANARRIKAVGLGLIAYSAAPFLANRAITAAGVTLDPVWFHVDEVEALIVGALLFVIADVMRFGREIEQERDGFV